jgi:hypothetical protein
MARRRLEGTPTYTWARGARPALQLYEPRQAGTPRADRVHRVVAGDRLDTLAARYLGDPDAGWRIVDANPTASVEGLLEPGRILAIPEGGS